ncbi:MAG: energy transducer TonB [Rhodanobacteraceae bacterium]|nr:energy transducer TonB [Rhodanobacteraceae bacterium]
MPSSPANSAPFLLLAPAEAASIAPLAGPEQDSDVVIPDAPASRRSALFALLLSLTLHGLAGAVLWRWSTESTPVPERPVLQIRLRAGGVEATPAAQADQPAAAPTNVATAPVPQRRPAALPAPHPPEPAKTAIAPTVPPALVALPERESATQASPAQPDLSEIGTDVVTPPEDPLVNTATVRVLEWLAQHRRYPGPARRARLQGTVEVVVVLMPDGRLVDQRIAHSSGHDILDKAALDLLRRASPVPMSAFFTGGARQLELRLPIIYRLSI